ncbi:M20/M25/M40 family metallo-hydrolase [Planococcus shenhongbingii]|uniref:M20/M25/M40 family metallo-hydrolase n=1 Tax=Planococcus shenhongbingii TaxID=3058398 RepID=A0ABT8NAY5_9BACL|nr:M20/M25/M40 family metallo-hydrolase [Planococcus sp. N017]MDN7245043.1 M20/M25/M40 family metallo-hydrolase [Planococcus sp. N017]
MKKFLFKNDSQPAKIKKSILSYALAGALVFSASPFAIPVAEAGSVSAANNAAQDQKIVKRVEAERAIEHVRYLSEEIGSRPGGLEAEKQAADYVARTLKGYGYDVEYQYFPVADQYIADVSFEDGTAWEMGAAPNGKISAEAVSGDVIYVKGGLSPSDFPTETKGKIVLLTRESTTANYRTQVDNAVKAGAAGVILQSVVGSRGNYGSAFNPSLTASYDVPVYGAAYVQGEWLKEQLEEGAVRLELTAARYTDLKSVNVIGTKKAKNQKADNKEVLLTAHMDSVVGAPGANDNASGVGLMLELARVYKGYNTDKELKFIAFGSEERGLLGARYYVDQLSQPERENIEAVFNPDMVATKYEQAKNLYAMTVDGSKNIVTDSTVAAGARLGNSDILPGQFGSSDHVPFHNAGIPAALFIWMGIDSWDPLVYHIEKVYHTPEDTIEDNISEERMQSALDIIGAGLFDVIRKDVPAAKK